jgi:Transglutaminase-like superfamily
MRWSDLAMLLIEAARCLGFGARVVTGYRYNPSADGGDTAVTGAGATHARADIYLPGAGWIAYDPTNGTVNGANLIRVAVTRDISQAVPIAGSFVGGSDDYLGHDRRCGGDLGARRRGAFGVIIRAWRCLAEWHPHVQRARITIMAHPGGCHPFVLGELASDVAALHQSVDIALSLNKAVLGHELCYELGELASTSPDFLADDLLGLGCNPGGRAEVVLAAGGPCVRCRLAPAGSTHNLHSPE